MNGSKGYWFRAFCLASRVLYEFFGEDWYKSNFSPDEKRKGFLRATQEMSEEYVLHIKRTISLAEMLFNMQNVDGIDECFEKILGGNIESAFAELEVSKLLFSAYTPFSLVKPSGVFGLDYDLEFRFANGRPGVGEIKCRIEEGDLNSNKIKRILESAHDQMPKDCACAIFLKATIPLDQDKAKMAELNQGIYRFICKNTKVKNVIHVFSDDQVPVPHISEILNAPYFSSVATHIQILEAKEWHIALNSEPNKAHFIQLADIAGNGMPDFFGQKI